MGVPYRFHLAMTDGEFRRFVGAPEGPQWICRRTVIWAKSLVRLDTQAAEGNAMPEPTRDRPSRNYEFLFLFTKSPDYFFDRSQIDVPARASLLHGVKANAGSVWETRCDIISDSDLESDGVWRIEPGSVTLPPYRHVATGSRSSNVAAGLTHRRYGPRSFRWQWHYGRGCPRNGPQGDSNRIIARMPGCLAGAHP